MTIDDIITAICLCCAAAICIIYMMLVIEEECRKSQEMIKGIEKK